MIYVFLEVINMPRQGLNKEVVINTAIQLIEEKGISHFLLNALAKSLNIKPASLYTHIQNIDALFTDIGKLAVNHFSIGW